MIEGFQKIKDDFFYIVNRFKTAQELGVAWQTFIASFLPEGDWKELLLQTTDPGGSALDDFLEILSELGWGRDILKGGIPTGEWITGGARTLEKENDKYLDDIRREVTGFDDPDTLPNEELAVVMLSLIHI